MYISSLKTHLDRVKKEKSSAGDVCRKVQLRSKSTTGNYGAGIEIFIPGNRISYRQAVYGDSDDNYSVQPY